jgi:hypothetical protein
MIPGMRRPIFSSLELCHLLAFLVHFRDKIEFRRALAFVKSSAGAAPRRRWGVCGRNGQALFPGFGCIKNTSSLSATYA